MAKSESKSVATPAVMPEDPSLVTKMLNEFRNFVAGAAEEAKKNFDPNPRKPKRFRLSPAGYATFLGWSRAVEEYHAAQGATVTSATDALGNSIGSHEPLVPGDSNKIGKNLAGIPVTEDNSLVGDAVLID